VYDHRALRNDCKCLEDRPAAAKLNPPSGQTRLLLRKIASLLEPERFWNKIREGPRTGCEMRDQRDNDAAAGKGIAPDRPRANEKRDLLHYVNWCPE